VRLNDLSQLLFNSWDNQVQLLGLWPCNRCFRRRFMRPKFSQDVVPVTTMKANPAKVINQVTEAHRPVLLTSRGKGVAVVQSIGDYESQTEEIEFMRAVVEGLRDLEKGKVFSVAETKAKFGIK
jgi:prevent-host-death family protein